MPSMTIEQALQTLDSANRDGVFYPMTPGLGEAIKVVAEGYIRESKEREMLCKVVAEICGPIMSIPQKELDKYFRRYHPGVGDYMGSGYLVIDAINRVWDEHVLYAEEETYREIQNIIEARRGPEPGGEG